MHEELCSNSLEGVPIYAERLLAAFPSFCNPTHPKPSQLGSCRLIVEARSSDAALTLLSHIAITQPGGVFWIIVLLKNSIVPLSPNQMGWRIAAECCGSHAG
jgi:hypothetical protein